SICNWMLRYYRQANHVSCPTWAALLHTGRRAAPFHATSKNDVIGVHGADGAGSLDVKSAHYRVAVERFPRRIHSQTWRSRERSQSSMANVLMEKPIQNAIPKNWLGARWVRWLVAKKTPITGRVVAMPSRIAIARIIHRRFRSSSPCRMCQ